MDEYLSTKEVAARVGLSDARIRQLCQEDGRLPGARKWGRDWAIPESAIKYFLTVARDKRYKGDVPPDDG